MTYASARLRMRWPGIVFKELIHMNESESFSQEETAAQSSPKESGPKRGRTQIYLSSAAFVMALAAVVFAATWAFAPDDAIEATEEHARPIQVVRHEHDWAIVYETVAHDAETHEEVIQPVYEHVTAHHSVCNECNDIIDGHAQEHIDATGHSGFSTNVPVEETRLVSEGRVEVVTDEPAYDELVATGRECTICGERQ